MARIRSIHPSMFTQRGLIKVSVQARLLYFGILTEADDAGAFEWEPQVLKVRILPVDNCDCAELLTELVQANLIVRYRTNGTYYGIVPDFTRHQRPRRPHYAYPIPDELRPPGSTGPQPDGGPPADLFEVDEHDQEVWSAERPQPTPDICRSQPSGDRPANPGDRPANDGHRPATAHRGPDLDQAIRTPDPIVAGPETERPSKGPPPRPVSEEAPAAERPFPTLSGIAPQRRGEERKRRVEEGERATHTLPRAGAPARVCARDPLADPNFSRFWNVYPRRQHLAEAWTAWRELVEGGTSPEQIIAGVVEFAFPDNPRYIPAPDRWLRGLDFMSPAVVYDAAMFAVGLHADGRPLLEVAA